MRLIPASACEILALPKIARIGSWATSRASFHQAAHPWSSAKTAKGFRPNYPGYFGRDRLERTLPWPAPSVRTRADAALRRQPPGHSEAIAGLAARGILHTRSSHRPVVQEAGYDAAIATLGSLVSHMRNGQTGISNLFDMRMFVEAALVRHAAKLAQPKDIDELVVAFHSVLYRIPGNASWNTDETAADFTTRSASGK